MFGVFVFSLLAASFARAASPAQCKCFPGDECWPSKELWDKFNTTLGGKVIANEPLAAPCHDPNYDESRCAAVKEKWLDGGVHIQSSSSIMAPLFANQSCDPFIAREIPCTLGNYPVYSVNISNSDDVVRTLYFAWKHNIRTVVRNTGHDYLGRSTAAGSIAIWLHNLKRREIYDWENDGYYQGKAMRVFAGVNGNEALETAKKENFVVMVAESPTVSVIGGYLQGGGHSGLSTTYGLAADNVLEFDVITPKGRYRTASRTENQDLYWALAGGGGGTYGVVVSATIKVHPDAPVAGASFNLALPEDSDPDLLYSAIDVWHAELPRLVDAGLQVVYWFGDGFLQVASMTAYNMTMNQMMKTLRPVNTAFQKISLRFSPSITSSPSYLEHYEKYSGPLPEGNIQAGTSLFGGRLIPRSVIATPEFAAAVKKIAKSDVMFIGAAMDVSKFGKDNVNSVLPAWRSSIVQASLVLPWDNEAPWEDILARQRKITEEVQPIIEAVTPGSGAYMNEANFQQPDWKETFYGENYERLLEIKNKFDPDESFRVTAGVGSDVWEVRNDGRMCRVEKVEEAEGQSKHDEL
ncbi:FAD-binding domain-containing protein [Lentithecium fluviatile CBS 122367]|uniref:FAD-binding domain-containing protein n=1 Tax=Lentithecium fluviatile CBS 122367 TaxID=1168545 RepID=A0A6G1INC0_9PLEO|nr:FAD-binding domain-containing protein [Lentithecium fluviatile CBS 122367]